MGPGYNLIEISQKLHEIKENSVLGGGGERVPCAPLSSVTAYCLDFVQHTENKEHLQLMNKPMADPGISWEVCQPQGGAVTNDCTNFHQKLHKKEETWAAGGWGSHLHTPNIRQCKW